MLWRRWCPAYLGMHLDVCEGVAVAIKDGPRLFSAIRGTQADGQRRQELQQPCGRQAVRADRCRDSGFRALVTIDAVTAPSACDRSRESRRII